MRGVLLKTIREVWLATLLFGVGLLVVEILLNLILPQIQEGIGTVMLNMPFVRQMLSALLGVDIENELTAVALHGEAQARSVFIEVVNSAFTALVKAAPILLAAL